MEPPLKPSDSDCCNSGCNPCILDVYEEQLKKYKNRNLNADCNLKKNCICETNYSIFKLTNMIKHTQDSYLLTFQYLKATNTPTVLSHDQLGLYYTPGQHFLLKGFSYFDKNDQFTRAYTPIPLDNDSPLTFTIIVRLYKQGEMSEFLKRLKVNSETLWRGPYGSFKVNYTYQHILLIAQGTGIAPLFSVFHEILNNEESETFVKLFFCCRTEHDILLRDKLYEWSSYWNFSYEVFLSLSSPSNIQCKYNEVIHSSRLNRSVIHEHVKDKIKDVQVLICGSETFNQNILEQVLDCGVNTNDTFLF